MYSFVTYHNSESELFLDQYIQLINGFDLEVVEQSYDVKYDETTLVIHGTKENFERFFMDDEGSLSLDIDEALDELVPVVMSA